MTIPFSVKSGSTVPLRMFGKRGRVVWHQKPLSTESRIEIRGSVPFFYLGWGKIKIRDPEHISESLLTIFGLKVIKFCDADPDSVSGISLTLDPGWKNSYPKHPRSATLVITNTLSMLNIYF
jgi:hypothetical protein